MQENEKQTDFQIFLEQHTKVFLRCSVRFNDTAQSFYITSNTSQIKVDCQSEQPKLLADFFQKKLIQQDDLADNNQQVPHSYDEKNQRTWFEKALESSFFTAFLYQKAKWTTLCVFIENAQNIKEQESIEVMFNEYPLHFIMSRMDDRQLDRVLELIDKVDDNLVFTQGQNLLERINDNNKLNSEAKQWIFQKIEQQTIQNEQALFYQNNSQNIKSIFDVFKKSLPQASDRAQTSSEKKNAQLHSIIEEISKAESSNTIRPLILQFFAIMMQRREYVNSLVSKKTKTAENFFKKISEDEYNYLKCLFDKSYDSPFPEYTKNLSNLYENVASYVNKIQQQYTNKILYKMVQNFRLYVCSDLKAIKVSIDPMVQVDRIIAWLIDKDNKTLKTAHVYNPGTHQWEPLEKSTEKNSQELISQFLDAQKYRGETMTLDYSQNKISSPFSGHDAVRTKIIPGMLSEREKHIRMTRNIKESVQNILNENKDPRITLNRFK